MWNQPQEPAALHASCTVYVIPGWQNRACCNFMARPCLEGVLRSRAIVLTLCRDALTAAEGMPVLFLPLRYWVQAITASNHVSSDRVSGP